ncbi:MAG: cob(I)yrinic acid a,c-diamide adenosyltransferase [Flavobacteriales bacterium]|jgi:cob(I)alamin adenosyltransferase
MKIYTKTGDKGTTSLLSGRRVNKNNIRIEAYGTVDELNSWIGVIRDHSHERYHKNLITIQNELFTIGSQLANDPEKTASFKLPDINSESVLRLEQLMDELNVDLPEMKNFVLPGGHELVSFIHVARCVCRRAERRVVDLMENQGVEELIIKYINRLSDYLFVLSRACSQEVLAVEIPWKPVV